MENKFKVRGQERLCVFFFKVLPSNHWKTDRTQIWVGGTVATGAHLKIKSAQLQITSAHLKKSAHLRYRVHLS